MPQPDRAPRDYQRAVGRRGTRIVIALPASGASALRDVRRFTILLPFMAFGLGIVSVARGLAGHGTQLVRDLGAITVQSVLLALAISLVSSVARWQLYRWRTSLATWMLTVPLEIVPYFVALVPYLDFVPTTTSTTRPPATALAAGIATMCFLAAIVGAPLGAYAWKRADPRAATKRR